MPSFLALLLPSCPGDNPLLYVTDCFDNRIQVFDTVTGLIIRSIGDGEGSGLGQLKGPSGLSLQLPFKFINRTLLCVTDIHNHRIQLFDAMTGEALRELPVGDEAHGGMAHPRGVVVHRQPDGSSLLFVSCSKDRVQVMAL